MNCFVTGTDTGSGKTLVTAGLLRALARRQLRAVAMKPLASGAHWREGTLINDDAELLRANACVALPREVISPYMFLAPTAPHIAAYTEGRRIELQTINQIYQEVRLQADVVLVEGIGGWALPLTESEMLADLVTTLGLPVVMVVGMRLGALNHALLTARAIVTDGLELLGWVGNVVDPDYAYARASFDSLRKEIPSPCLGILPWQRHSTPDIISPYLDRAAALLATPRAPVSQKQVR